MADEEWPQRNFLSLGSDYFDMVCKLAVEKPTNQIIAERLSSVMGRKITRWAVGAWRHGKTPVPLPIYLAVRAAAEEYLQRSGMGRNLDILATPLGRS